MAFTNPSHHGVRIIAFEAQARHAGERSWITVRVSRQWSAIEDAVDCATRTVDPIGRRVVETQVVAVDHSASVDFRSALWPITPHPSRPSRRLSFQEPT